MTKPRWDSDARELWLGRMLCRRFPRYGASQWKVLDAFQSRSWPKSIASPFATNEETHNTLRKLNETQKVIKFHRKHGNIGWSLMQKVSRGEYIVAVTDLLTRDYGWLSLTGLFIRPALLDVILESYDLAMTADQAASQVEKSLGVSDEKHESAVSPRAGVEGDPSHP